MRSEDFLHALLVRRLTDYGIDIEFKSSHPFGLKAPGTTTIREPLHEQTAERLIESCENIARTIAFKAEGKRCKAVCTYFTVGQSDLQITVFSLDVK